MTNTNAPNTTGPASGITSVEPQVDFYVLDKDSPSERLKFVCRFLEKLQKLGKSARILVEDAESARALDAFIWQYPVESFLPHSLATEIHREPDKNSAIDENQNNSNTPVIIQQAEQLANDSRQFDVLIDLSTGPASAPAQHPRIVEVVIQEPVVLTCTRARYKFYREQGYPLQSHPIQIR